MGKVEEAMEAAREIEKGKGAPADPKADPKGQPVPPGEPGKPAVTPPAKGKEPDPVPVDPLVKMQEENKALKEENEQTKARITVIERQKAQVPPAKEPEPVNPLKPYSDDELINYKITNQTDPTIVAKIEKELNQRQENRVYTRVKKESDQNNLLTAHNSEAVKEHSELSDPNSEISKLTKQIMDSDSQYQNHPMGYRVAANYAEGILLKKENAALKEKVETTTDDERKEKLALAKKKQEAALSTGGGAQEPTPGVDEEFEKSLEGLPSARPGSPEFMAHLRALEKKQAKSAQ